jgi:hypothetical protein
MGMGSKAEELGYEESDIRAASCSTNGFGSLESSVYASRVVVVLSRGAVSVNLSEKRL